MMISPAKVLAMLCLLQALWLLPARAADAPVAAVLPVVPVVPEAASAVTPRLLEAFHGRVKSINAGGLPLSSYHLAKAQACVDAAVDAYHLGDRGELMLQSLAQADRLMARVAAADSTAMAMQMTQETPLLAGATRLREDLWQQAVAMKPMPGLRCAHAPLARFKVMLVMAGYRHAHSGWRDANAYVQASERLARQALAQIDGCPPEAAPPAAAAAASAPPLPRPTAERAGIEAQGCVAPPAAAAAAVAEPRITRVEKIVLEADALFHFNRSAPEHLRTEKGAELDALAAQIVAMKSVEQVRVLGYTDELGGIEYNLRLSLARAETIRAYLVARGVTAAAIRTEGRGEADPIASCENVASRQARIACLAPNRRVGIEVSGVLR